MQTKAPLMLTDGKGEDEGEGDEEEESSEVEVPLKKKGKVTITKPKIAIFAWRSSRKKSDKEEEQIIFKKSPPTLQQSLKDMEEGVGVVNFKILKYDTRTIEEKKQIEDMVMKKMGKWKYSLD